MFNPDFEATIPKPCQVRSRTQSPCPHRAVVKIRGVAFCGACAREQEAYFAIGELVAQEERRSFRTEPLAQALKRMRRERAAGTQDIAAEIGLDKERVVQIRAEIEHNRLEARLSKDGGLEKDVSRRSIAARSTAVLMSLFR
jgi:hypothetical protein